MSRQPSPSVLLLREWFGLGGTWMIYMHYVQMQQDTIQVAACKKIKKKIEQDCSLCTPERQLLHWPTQCRSRRWCRTNVFRLLLSSREQSLSDFTVSDFTLWGCPASVWQRGQSPGSAILIRGEEVWCTASSPDIVQEFSKVSLRSLSLWGSSSNLCRDCWWIQEHLFLFHLNDVENARTPT